MISMSENLGFEKDEMAGWGAKDPRRKKLDLGGEKGEYHSMVLDGPLYKHGIEILGVPATDNDNQSQCHNSIQLLTTVSGPAKNGEDRWWTYDGQTRWSLGTFIVRTKKVDEQQ